MSASMDEFGLADLPTTPSEPTRAESAFAPGTTPFDIPETVLQEGQKQFEEKTSRNSTSQITSSEGTGQFTTPFTNSTTSLKSLTDDDVKRLERRLMKKNGMPGDDLSSGIKKMAEQITLDQMSTLESRLSSSQTIQLDEESKKLVDKYTQAVTHYEHTVAELKGQMSEMTTHHGKIYREALEVIKAKHASESVTETPDEETVDFMQRLQLAETSNKELTVKLEKAQELSRPKSIANLASTKESSNTIGNVRGGIRIPESRRRI